MKTIINWKLTKKPKRNSTVVVLQDFGSIKQIVNAVYTDGIFLDSETQTIDIVNVIGWHKNNFIKETKL